MDKNTDFQAWAQQFCESEFKFETNDKLVLDGNLFIKWLKFNIPTKLRESHRFGFDNVDFTAYARDCIKQLNSKFTIIVILDGATKTDVPRVKRLSQLKERYKQHLETAIKIFEDPNSNLFANNDIHWPSASTILIQIFRDLKIFHRQAINGADDIVATFARYTQNPVVSNDLDYLLMDLPEGVVHMSGFLNLFLKFDESGVCTAESLKNFTCKRYLLKNVLAKFPKLSLELVPLANVFLKYDGLNVLVGKRFITVLKKQINGDPQIVHFKTEAALVLFQWLSERSSFEEAINELQRFVGEVEKMVKNNPIIKYNSIKKTCEENQLLVDEFVRKLQSAKPPLYEDLKVKVDKLRPNHQLTLNFVNRMQKDLFPKKDLPDKIYHGLVHGRIDPRFLDILRHRIDIFWPLIEDFSITESSNQCTYDLYNIIYSIILGPVSIEASVTRLDRQGKKQVSENISLSFVINDTPLPTLRELEGMEKSQLEEQFFQIVQHACFTSAIDFESLRCEINQKLPTGFLIMLLSLIMADHKCPKKLTQTKMWSAFSRAKFANIVFLGLVGSTWDQSDFSKFFAFEKAELDLLQQRLKQFDCEPSGDFNSAFLYCSNAYRNCLNSFNFLAQIMILHESFGVALFFFGLKGPFVYNLTFYLLKNDNINYFEDTMLGIVDQDGQQFKNLNAIKQLWESFRTNTPDSSSYETRQMKKEEMMSFMERTKSSQVLKRDFIYDKLVNAKYQYFHKEKLKKRKSGAYATTSNVNTKKKRKRWSRDNRPF